MQPQPVPAANVMGGSAAEFYQNICSSRGDDMQAFSSTPTNAGRGFQPINVSATSVSPFGMTTGGLQSSGGIQSSGLQSSGGIQPVGLQTSGGLQSYGGLQAGGIQASPSSMPMSMPSSMPVSAHPNAL